MPAGAIAAGLGCCSVVTFHIEVKSMAALTREVLACLLAICQNCLKISESIRDASTKQAPQSNSPVKVTITLDAEMKLTFCGGNVIRVQELMQFTFFPVANSVTCIVQMQLFTLFSPHNVFLVLLT